MLLMLWKIKIAVGNSKYVFDTNRFGNLNSIFKYSV